MTEGQTLRPRSRFMAAALSAALVVGMAPSFALIAPSEAYAADNGALAPAQITVQETVAQILDYCKVGSPDYTSYYVYVGPQSGSISSDYMGAATQLSVDDKTLTKGSNTYPSNGEYTYDSNWLYLPTSAFSNGDHTLSIKATGYEDLAVTITCSGFEEYGNKKAQIKAPEVEKKTLGDVKWTASYYSGDSFGGFTLGGLTDADFKSAIKQVKVNNSVRSLASGGALEYYYQYTITSESPYALSIGDGGTYSGLRNGANTVTITADGYNDVEVTVHYNSELKIASLKEIIDVSSIKWSAEYGQNNDYVDLVILNPANGSGLVEDITGITIGATDYTATEKIADESSKSYSFENGRINLNLDGFADGKNTVKLHTATYGDIDVDVYYDSVLKKASIEAIESIANKDPFTQQGYRAIREGDGATYSGFYGGVQLAMPYLFRGLLKSKEAYKNEDIDYLEFEVSVNGKSYDLVSARTSTSPETNKAYVKVGSDISSENGFYLKGLDEGENSVELKVYGEDKDELLQTLNFTVNYAGDADPKDAGEYQLNAKFYNESSYVKGAPTEFNLAGMFDSTIKLVKDQAGLSVSLIYVNPTPMASITIDHDGDDSTPMATAEKVGYGAKNVDGTYNAYEFKMPIDTLVKDHKITFNMGFHNPSVYLHGVNADETFKAYDGSDFVKLGSNGTQYVKGTAAGEHTPEQPSTFTADIAVLNASNLAKESMAAACVEGPATLSIAADGTVAVSVGLKSMTMGGITATPKKVSVFQTAGGTGELVEGTVSGDGSKLTFSLPEACKAIDGVFVEFTEIEGTGMNYAPTAFLALKYDGNEPDLAKVESAVAEEKAAKEQADKEKAEKEAAEKKEAEEKAAKEAAEKKAAEEKAAAEQAAKEAQEKAAKESAEKKAAAEQAAKEAQEKAAAEQAAKEAAQTIASVKLASTSVTYTGKTIKPKVTVTAKDGSTVSAANYTVKYANNVNVGKATVTVTGKGAYKGTAKATFKITKAAAKAKATTSKTLTAKNLKKKAASFTAIKLTTDGKVTYKVTKKDAKKVLTFKKGKVSVKKGSKVGTYTLKVKVSAKAGKNYKALKAKTYTIKVKVS